MVFHEIARRLRPRPETIRVVFTGVRTPVNSHSDPPTKIGMPPRCHRDGLADAVTRVDIRRMVCPVIGSQR